jgi:hypothetical protein
MNFSGKTPIASLRFRVPRVWERERRLSLVVGWLYQVVLWSLILFGSLYTAYERMARIEPANARLHPTAQIAHTIP